LKRAIYGPLSFLGVKAQAYVKIHPKGKIKVQNIPRARQISFDTIFYEVVEYKEGALTILVDSMNRYVYEVWVTKSIGMDKCFYTRLYQTSVLQLFCYLLDYESFWCDVFDLKIEFQPLC